jgi:branched-chain amino acid transport system substrate-binding protein
MPVIGPPPRPTAISRRSAAVAGVLALFLASACSARVSSDKAKTSSSSAPPSSPAAPKQPLVLAEVGDFSSIVGAALAPSRDAVQAWAKIVNARGGIDGHQVKLLVGDDAGDSAKSLQLVQNFVQSQGAIALLNYAGSADATISTYAEAHRIPIIGGLPDESWFKSWAAFPTQSPQANYGYAIAKIAAGEGATKVGALYCSESPICHDSERGFVSNAPKVGLDVAYEASISIVQPDFTAECLQAKSKGVTVLLPVTDGNSISRLAKSCSRQDYHPTIINLSPTTQQASQPELDGMIAVLRDFPWFLTSGSPALSAYGTATAGQKTQFQSAIGWSAAQLLERAASHLSPTPTSNDLFAGLWSLHDETLGGLVTPLTFTRMKPPTPASCAFEAKVVGGKWTAPNGVHLTGCLPTS